MRPRSKKLPALETVLQLECPVKPGSQRHSTSPKTQNREAREAGERSKPAPVISRFRKGFSLRQKAVDAAPLRWARTANGVSLALSPASRASPPNALPPTACAMGFHLSPASRARPHSGLRPGLVAAATRPLRGLLGLASWPPHFWEKSLKRE